MKNKTVALFVSGGIAAYKACELTSRLKKLGADVHIVLTKNAQEFVTPLTFETLSNNRVITDMFDPDRMWEVEHISLAKKADLFIIAPATANIIGKIACGIADDFASTTVMAASCPVLIAPAMNTNMYNSAAYRHNQDVLIKRGFSFVEPDEGVLACGDSGKGRLCDIDKLVKTAQQLLRVDDSLKDKHVLITLGATQEPLDPVRHITNRSSGKMGVSLAKAALDRGARVTLVCGIVSVELCLGVDVIRVNTTEQMYDAVHSVKNVDYYIMAAAPSDYRISDYSSSKIKGESITLSLVKNVDIASSVGQKIIEDKSGSRLIIFSAETHNLLENAKEKMVKKNAHMVVANDVTLQGAGFNTDTNIAAIITHDSCESLSIMTKDELAAQILTRVVRL